MKIFEINSVPYGSTCNIMLGIAELAKQSRHSIITSSGYSTHPVKNLPEKHFNIGGVVDKSLHMVFAQCIGLNGCFSYFSTLKLLLKMKKYKPDIIHLHNLHGWFINLPLLFNFIKKHNINVVWTLHDCWSFTGHCPHFDMIGCDKWKTGCFSCPQYRDYPKSVFDNSKYMYSLKKKWFTGVPYMTVVTPSEWLAGLVKQSFLRDYQTKVINNGIDLSIFKPTESDFRKKYNCENKYILLGVAFGWGKRKGLDVFIELSKSLDESYKIVLVGTDDNVDKVLPDKIISIHRTQNQAELAEIYTAADLFVNPTREENYPTVNMESIACGTPVVTFDTGGSPECLDKNCGCVVPKNDIDAMYREIIRICKEKPYSSTACIERAKSFDMKDRFSEYIKLYEEINEPKQSF